MHLVKFENLILKRLPSSFPSPSLPSCQVVFLGDPSVGKTCVAKLYINRKPPSNVQSTIAFDCKCKDVDIDGIPSTVSTRNLNVL